MAVIPGVHPGFPGSIPGQGIKISLHTTAHHCLVEIRVRVEIVQGEKTWEQEGFEGAVDWKIIHSLS